MASDRIFILIHHGIHRIDQRHAARHVTDAETAGLHHIGRQPNEHEIERVVRSKHPHCHAPKLAPPQDLEVGHLETCFVFRLDTQSSPPKILEPGPVALMAPAKS